MEKDGKNHIMIKKHVLSYIGVVVIFAIFKYIEYTISLSKKEKIQEFDHFIEKPVKKQKKHLSWKEKKNKKKIE